MKVLAHFADEVRRGDEQRGSARRSLRLDVPGETPASGEVAVTIHDLSLTGVLIQTSAPLGAGESFWLELPEAGSAEATILWTSGDFYGCQFKAPISPAGLSAALLKGEARRSEVVQAVEDVDVLAELESITAQVRKITQRVERTLSHFTDEDDDAADR